MTMDHHSKIIIALDFDNRKDVFNLLDKVDPEYCAIKIGLELFTLYGLQFVNEIIRLKYKIFLDLKLHDIPTTVSRTCCALGDIGLWMLNVHASGGLEMMTAASSALSQFQSPPLLIAVTVLTSMSKESISTLGIKNSLQQQVLCLAQLAKQAKLDGVVCSPQESAMIKSNCGSEFLTITPGIRFDNHNVDDQVRIETPESAIAAGSDYLVIGRPITRAVDPEKVISEIMLRINNKHNLEKEK